MELRLDLEPQYYEAAARLYEDGSLKAINRTLAEIGVHISFTTSQQPRKAGKPEGVCIYAEGS